MISRVRGKRLGEKKKETAKVLAVSGGSDD
jgi:hypothetical protein